MRLFSPAALLTLGGLFAATASAANPKVAAAVAENVKKSELGEVPPPAAIDDEFTTFNGKKVPKIKDVGGEKLDELVSHGYNAVKFFSPQCIHCQHAAPLWQTLYEYYWTSSPIKAGSTSKDSLNDFHHYYDFDFLNVNCLAFGDSCTKFDVSSYPTFIIFKEGKEIARLHGARDMKGMGEFLEGVLESIKPGSRVKGGIEYPEAGATEFVAKPIAVEAGKVPPKPVETSEAGPVSTGDPAKPVTAVKKPPGTPNLPGTSVPLDYDSFMQLVTATQEPWFIKFYAPWCGHCQALAPVWTELGKEMQGKLNIGEVDCEADKRLCKDLRVGSYPTMMYFARGERVEYEGLRGLGDLVHYAEKATEINDGIIDVDAATFKELEEKNEVIFVYFYDMATTSEDFIALNRLQLSLIGHAKLVKTQDPAMSERFKITTWPRLIVSRDGRPTYYAPITPNEMRDYRQVLHWMKSVWLPIVPELLPTNAREIMDGKIVVLGILTRDRADDFILAKNEIKSAAMEWMDKQVTMFQIERQEFRDAKQLRIEEAEARDDERALRAAKSIRIDMNRSERKEVTFAWVDGVFWERWIRTTYGIQVQDGERVIINDEDVSIISIAFTFITC